METLARHGGTPRKLLYLVQHCAAQHHCFVTFEPGNLDAEMRAAGATVECVGSTSIFRITRAIVDAARRHRADLICTHFTRALVCGAAAARWLDIPLMHNAHGPAIAPRPSVNGHVGHFASRWSMPAANLVTANSRFTAGTLQRVFGVPADKIRVIPNPVTPRSRSAPPGDVPARASGSLRLVQTGGLIPVRRQHVLIEGLAKLVNAGVESDLLMIGDGPRRGELGALAHSLGIADRIHWLGYRDDIGDLLAAADMYVSAIDSEGFGIAVVEAMLQGIPVVLANGGAHPEITDNGRVGVLFEAGDSDAFARAVADLWHDTPRCTALAAEAARYAAHSYAPRHYVERFGGLVEEARRV